MVRFFAIAAISDSLGFFSCGVEGIMFCRGKVGHYRAMKAALDDYYPRSFFKLLLLALAVVAVLLILAFVNAALYVERLADQSQTVVVQAAQAARGSRLLMEQVTTLERAVRQYLILGDAAILENYENLRQRFRANAGELSLLPLDEAQLHELNRTIDREQALYEMLRKLPPGDTVAPAQRNALVEGYLELSGLARSVLEVSNELIDREVERLRATADRAQRILWWQLFATVPVGILLAVIATILIARPIRQLDEAIRSLGSGELVGGEDGLGGRIRIGGPADLVYLGDRLEWLRCRLLELEEQKQRFLRHVSHELKTPLTSLREGAELLDDGTAGELTPAQREIVAILRRQSAELQRLIGDLLDYQRAHEELARLDMTPVDLADVVRRAAADQQLAAAARSITIDLDLQTAQLVADAGKLRVVVDNLLSNAVKYSPDGGMVAVGLRQAGDAWELDVRDDGPGIAVTERERVFDWFFQGQRSHHGRVQGSGLGLAIARDLVLAHGGRIDIVDHAEVGDVGGAAAVGAHFRVRLPFSPSRLSAVK